MGDSQSIVPSLDVYEGDKHVIAATRHIVKALVLTNNMSNDLREILVDLDTRLSRMTTLGENDTGGTSEPGDRFLCANENVISWQCDPRAHYDVEDRLIYAQKKVIRWQSDQSMIWDSGPDEASEYLQAVDEVRRLAESLGSLLSQGNGKEKELLDSAHGVLQMAMTRLEEELLQMAMHTWKYQNHATNYESATWSHVLSLLKDDRTAGKANLKETYGLFNIAFEEVYKNQTAWSVQNSELREELQIRTLHMVIPAYWNLSTKTSKCIRDKYIKYTTDDLQNYIMDLFEGSPKTLNNFWKR